MRFPAGTECAHQWWKNGDHPDDGERVEQVVLYDEDGETKQVVEMPSEGNLVRYYRHPDVDGEAVHDLCGEKWDDHGWIDSSDAADTDGLTVCPGDWIVRTKGLPAVWHPAESREPSDRYEVRYCCKDCGAQGPGLGTTHFVGGSHRVSVFEVVL